MEKQKGLTRPETPRDGKLLPAEHGDTDVVRRLNWIRQVDRGYFRPKGAEEVGVEDFLRITREAFDTLRSYGIAVPATFSTTTTERDGLEATEVYAAVDRIERAPAPDSAALGEAFATLREQLLRYFRDRFEHNESYLADLIDDTQYVYGKKAGDSGNRLYLVDVDPYLYHGTVALQRIIGDAIDALKAEAAYFNNPRYGQIIAGYEDFFREINRAEAL